MQENTVYQRLAEHLSCLGMGYPCREDLIEILKENFSEKEAAVALAIPNTVIPLQPIGVEEIERSIDLPREDLLGMLNTILDLENELKLLRKRMKSREKIGEEDVDRLKYIQEEIKGVLAGF